MKFICPNTGCGAVYEVNPDQFGTRFNCKECGAALLVEAKGLRLANPPLPPRPDAPVIPIMGMGANPGTGQRKNSNSSGENAMSLGKFDLATWFFAAGAVLIIFFLFNPIIDQTKTWYQRQLIRSGDDNQRRLDEELRRKISNDLNKERKENDKFFRERRENPPKTKDETDAWDAREKARLEKRKESQKKRDEWQEKRDDARAKWQDERGDLEKERDKLENRASWWSYFYTWGMMFGFLFLACASVSYLRPSQSLNRRIVGSIVICAQVLVIFFAYVLMGVRTR